MSQVFPTPTPDVSYGSRKKDSKWTEDPNILDLEPAVEELQDEMDAVETRLDTAESDIDNLEDRATALEETTETPTYSDDTTTTDTITDLPSSTIEGGFEKMTVDGRLVVNLLSDTVAGCEATTGWTDASTTSSVDSNNAFEGNYCIKITNAGYTYRDVLPLMDTSKYYMFSVYAKNGDFSTGLSLRINCVGDLGWKESSVSTATIYTRLAVLIQPSDFDTATNVYLALRGQGSATEYGFFDAIQIVEISSADYALGASALLDKYQYHRGIKPVDKMRVLSEGKNLFDGAYLQDTTISSNPGVEGDLGSTAGTRTTKRIKCKPNTIYTISGGDRNRWRFEDEVGNKIIFANNNQATITTPSNAKYMYVYYSLDGSHENIQLEKGSTATTYEPYQSSQSVCPVELRDVPSGTADSWNAKTGEVVKRISDADSIADTDYDSLDNTTYTNVDVVKTTAYSTMKAATTSADGITRVLNSSGVELSEVAQADIDNTASIGKYYVHTDETIWFITAAGTYADIATARTGLGTSTVYYEKTPASYTTTYYPASVVQSYPSGRFIQEPYIEEQVQYGSNITILDSNYPIANLVYVNKIDIATGALTPVPLSDCTVASDGLSFTVSTASVGEWYDYGYRYNFLSTNGSVEYSYNTNLKAQVSNNTQDIAELSRQIGNLQKVNPISEIGTVTLTNSLTYPFNDSQETVSLDYIRTGTNYIVTTEITSVTGDDAGDIVISDKATNGFKIEFTGSATSVTVTYIVQEVL